MHIQRHSQLLRHRRERTTPASPAHPLGTPYPREREDEAGDVLVDGWMDGGWAGGATERERSAGGRGGRDGAEEEKGREGCCRDLLRVQRRDFVHDTWKEENPP